jgi:hypothetical protein
VFEMRHGVLEFDERVAAAPHEASIFETFAQFESTLGVCSCRSQRHVVRAAKLGFRKGCRRR